MRTASGPDISIRGFRVTGDKLKKKGSLRKHKDRSRLRIGHPQLWSQQKTRVSGHLDSEETRGLWKADLGKRQKRVRGGLGCIDPCGRGGRREILKPPLPPRGAVGGARQ